MKDWLFRIVILVLLMVPVFFVLLLSNQEIDKYKPRDSITNTQVAFGYGEKIIIGSLSESLPLQGMVDSLSYESILIPANSTNYYFFEKGDELFVGKPLYMVNGETINSMYAGIIDDVVSKPEGIELIIKTSDELVVVATIGDMYQLGINQTYETSEGTQLTLLTVSDMYETNGRRHIFKSNDQELRLNQPINSSLLTGRKEDHLLIAPSDCVYKGSNGMDTIRIVSEDGKVVREQEVRISLRSDYSVAVDGVSQGELCDVEYGKYQNSSIQGFSQ